MSELRPMTQVLHLGTNPVLTIYAMKNINLPCIVTNGLFTYVCVCLRAKFESLFARNKEC